MQKIHKIIIAIGVMVAIIAIVTIIVFLAGGKQLSLSSVEAKNGDVTEKIQLTGQVKASQGVDLAFEVSGKIVENNVKVGDKIYAGQPLLAIDSSILQSQLKQAEAQLDVLNIDTVESKTNSSLQSIYINAISTAQKSISVAKDILLNITDIQYNHFAAQTQQNIALQDAKEVAVNSLLGQTDASQWTSQSIAQLNGGAFAIVSKAIENPTQDNIDSALLATKNALQNVDSLISAVPIDPALTSVERTSINSAKTSINSEIITTYANIQAISAQKVNNSATVTTANAQLESAQAAINTIKAQISKTVITALFDGQVDKNNSVIGQSVSPNVPVITISNNNLEIDTYIPEIDLSETKVGGNADITLDAFGNGKTFPAVIFSVDSAPSTINGVSAYGARLKFKNFDSTIKPGMTANITLISDTHSNVLLIPKSAVIQNNNKYFVIVNKGNSQKETREVTIGLNDGKNIEIISGLKLGEKVFAY